MSGNGSLPAIGVCNTGDDACATPSYGSNSPGVMNNNCLPVVLAPGFTDHQTVTTVCGEQYILVGQQSVLDAAQAAGETNALAGLTAEMIVTLLAAAAPEILTDLNTLVEHPAFALGDFVTAWNDANGSDQQEFQAAVNAPEGSGWINADNQYGEDDVLRNTPGYTNIGDL